MAAETDTGRPPENVDIPEAMALMADAVADDPTAPVEASAPEEAPAEDRAESPEECAPRRSRSGSV